MDLLQKRLPIRTSLGQQQPLPIPWPNLVNDGLTHLFHIWLNLTCLNTLLNQFLVVHINKNITPLSSTLISGPIPVTTSNGKSCPPFIKPSFIQGSSPASTTSKFSWVSNLPPIPSPVNLTHQEELFKWLQDLPVQGYHIDNKSWWTAEGPTPKDQTHEHVQTSQHAEQSRSTTRFHWHNQPYGEWSWPLSCWWHFDHCINTAIRLEAEAETQWMTTKNLFRRLQLLNIDKKFWLIIVTEHGRVL